MALYPLQPGMHPLGQFDVVDTELTAIKGGEVLTLTSASRTNTTTETASQDALDGYLYSTSSVRPASTRASTAAQYPLYLADDGSSPDYLTYFGQLTGPMGLGDGAVLGPHSASGSGKVTLWDKPGLFAVSVDALASDFVSTIGASGLAVGASLGFGSGADIGKLAHNACANKVAATGVARFVEFSSEPGLVSTPKRLVGAAEAFTRVVIQWDAGLGVRTL